MNTVYKPGFTIIETMLFLAISGVLVATLLVGAGSSISIQRYRDSVVSLQSFLQDQYLHVGNVSNEIKPVDTSCSNAVVVETPGSGAGRGQTDCVVMGKYITTTDEKTLSVSTVIGYINPDTKIVQSNDVAVLNEYALNILPTSTTQYLIEWGASMVRPASSAPQSFSMLIIRSPTSGIIRTFIDPSRAVASSALGSLVSSTYTGSPLNICLDDGGTFGMNKMAVFVVANATGPSGIETVGEATSGC